MKKLHKVESVVEEILNDREDARKNDDILYLYVCERFDVDTSTMTLKNFLNERNTTSCPSFASVTRARRKVFEKRPELKPKKVTEMREAAREAFIDYALS